MSEKEWRRRRKDRPEGSSSSERIQQFREEVERRKLTEVLERYKKNLKYERWRSAVLFKICFPLVRERLGNIRVVNPSLAYEIEEFIVKLYISGKVSHVNFDVFKKIIQRIMETRRHYYQ